MKPFAAVAVALTIAACDPTVTVVTGVSHDGGATPRTLAFTVQPENAAPGDIITPAIQVAALDSLGNTDVTFGGSVAIRLGANPSGASLGGTKTVGAVSGVASFGDLSVDKVGSGYTLIATASGASAAASSGFAIVAPPGATARR